MEASKLLLVLLGVHIHHELPSRLVLMLLTVLWLYSSHHSVAVPAPFILSQVELKGDRMERLLAVMDDSPIRADLIVHWVPRFLILAVHLRFRLYRVARTVQQELVSALRGDSTATLADLGDGCVVECAVDVIVRAG